MRDLAKDRIASEAGTHWFRMIARMPAEENKERLTGPDIAIRDLAAGQADSILRSILNSVDYGILLTSLDHISLACNRRFGELWGVDIRDVVANDTRAVRAMVRTRIPDFEAWSRNLDDLYQDPEEVQRDELELTDPPAVLRRYAGPVRDATGNVVARLWTFQDRTAEKRLERMREFLHEASLVFDPDPKNVYDFITRKVAEQYRSLAILSIRGGDEMLFRSVAGLPPDAPFPPNNPISDSYCQFCLQRRAPLIIQDARVDPEASKILPARLGVTRYAGVPLWAPDETIIGTLCILDNRSDEILDEEDLRFLSLMAMRISSELDRERQLQRLERDLAATQSSLIQSEKLAVTGTLAASIAHDIRNILSAISLTISMGKEEPAETLAELSGHLDRFTVLSHRLLSYARPHLLVRERVSIVEALQRVLDLLASHFHVAHIQVEVTIEPDLPAVMADPSRLDHLFVNLLLNGIQASESAASLHVLVFRREDRVVVELKDEGRGMNPSDLEQLFEPFSTTRSQGFGLGLYSCRQIVRESGGDIKVTSNPGSGTTFLVEFPGI